MLRTTFHTIGPYDIYFILFHYKIHTIFDNITPFPKRPGKNIEAMEKWDDYHEKKRIDKRRRDTEMWEETVGEKAQQKIHMKDQIHSMEHDEF